MNRFTRLQGENEDCRLVRGDEDISLTIVVSFESTKKTSQQQDSISKKDATSSETTCTNKNRQNHGATSKTTQENNYNNKTTTRDSPIILIGDSMIKNIIPRKIPNRQIIKCTFPGKTAEEIKSEINAISTELLRHISLFMRERTQCAKL